MHYRGWRTGLDSMRDAKLKKTWRQRVRRWGRRKPETILRLGESQDHMVVVTDRLHDLDWVPLAGRPAQLYWWVGRDGAIYRAPDERWGAPSMEVGIELNLTSELPRLEAGSSFRMEIIYHDGRDWCLSRRGNARVRRSNESIRTREEVFIRQMAVIACDEVEVDTTLSYADFLQLDTSSFIDGWWRWLIEWVRYVRVSVFGDR